MSLCKTSCVFWAKEPCRFLSKDLPLLVHSVLKIQSGHGSIFKTANDMQSFQPQEGSKYISLPILADDITKTTVGTQIRC